MYHVLANDQTLYYPANTDYTIYDTELKLDVGLAGEFKFKVPPNNPMYAQVGQGTIITILRDNVEYWRGEVKETSTDINKVMSVYCLEDLAWLSDEFLFPSYIDNETYYDRFTAAITAYNTGRTADKQFTVGYLTNVNSAATCIWATEYEWSVLDSLRNCIAKDTGYLRVRRATVGGVLTRYIDCVRLSDYGTAATQPIRFGINLLDYLEEMNLDNFVNDLYPYGAETDTQIYDEYNQRLAGTHIQNSTSIGAYGKHSKAVVFDTDDLTTLDNLASAYLSRYSQPQLTLKIDAIDLAEITTESHFEIGDSIKVIAEPFAIDQNMYLTAQSIDLQDVGKNKVTLSSYVVRGTSLTSQSNAAADAIQKIPSKSSILDAAKKNAYEILTGENGGYVTFEKNSDDQITELRIANDLDIDKATKCWKWNLNGLAYLNRTVYTDPWTVTIAATMDGGFVADFITAGTLTLQHDGALLRALNTSDQLIVKVDEDGLYAIRGEIAGFTIDSDGFLKNSGGIYAKYGYTGATIGKLINDSYWARTDYVPDSGYLRIDYGSLSNGGLWITNVGNNTYWDMGSHYVHVYATNIYSSDYGYPTWSGSDRRIKRDIEDLSIAEAKLLIMELRPRKFQMLAENGGRMGFVAQEVREVIPDDSALEYGTDDMRCINYNDITAPLVACIKDLYAEISALRNEIEKLKGERNG